MEEVAAQLVAPDEGVARLFTPPFEHADPDPGYIRAYPPGVRENGGQYTHGATWSIFAYAALGREDRAGALFALLNPVNHARTPFEVATYRVEPYVVAADVYSVPPHVGRGGWTWYTGASGWLYRAGSGSRAGPRGGRRSPACASVPPAGLDVRRGESGHTPLAGAGDDHRQPRSWPRRVERIELDGTPLDELDVVAPPADDQSITSTS